MRKYSDYRRCAREKLKDNWGIAVVVCLIVSGVASLSGAIPYIGFIATILLTGQITVGLYRFFINLKANEKPNFNILFAKFKEEWTSNMLTYLLVSIYQVLWFLLFIVPGIIKKYSYAMTMYLKAKEPNLSATEAITLSRKMMYGNKWRLCCLEFTFVGWFILSILSFGIGFIFLEPYMKATFTEFYEEVYNKYREANPSVIVETPNNEEIHL